MVHHIALIYGSTKGQTRKISDRIATQLDEYDCEVDVYDVEDVPDDYAVASCDGVIIGAPLYAGKFPKAISKYVREHRNVLQHIPAAFFSVGMLAAMESGDGPTTSDQLNEELLDDLDWKPMLTEAFAGAVPFSQYGFFKRLIMKFIMKRNTSEKIDTSKDYEYTDWHRVERFAERYLSRLGEMKAPETAPRERS